MEIERFLNGNLFVGDQKRRTGDGVIGVAVVRNFDVAIFFDRWLEGRIIALEFLLGDFADERDGSLQ